MQKKKLVLNMTLSTSILMALLCCGGCSSKGTGGTAMVGVPQYIVEEEIEPERKAAEQYFDTDRCTMMNAIKNGYIDVEEDERYGDNKDCIESCKSKSGLFHMDIFDHHAEYNEKSDGTYMVQIIFDLEQLKTEDGEEETKQLLREVFGQLGVEYEKDTLWDCILMVIADRQKDEVSREMDYKDNVHIMVAKESLGTEIRMRIEAIGHKR